MNTRTLFDKAVNWFERQSWRPHITRTRVAVTGVTLIAVGLALGGLDRQAPTDADLAAKTRALVLPDYPAGADAITDSLAAPDTGVEEAMAALDAAAGMTTPQLAALTPATRRLEAWESVEVRRGQTLDRIFRDQSFSVGLLHEILSLNDDTKRLTRIRPGDVFEFQRGAEGSLQRMRFPIDENAYLIVNVEPEGPVASRQERELFRETVEAEGRIDSSLFNAAKAAGMSDNLTMQLANIFAWDIDFALDIRAGDRFFVLYEKVYRDGEYLRDGDILAATFVNQGERFQALRFMDEDGDIAYFAPDGRPMKKAFLRAPLNFSRVSSSFNPRRFHPVLRRIKPHNGIDYVAPVGTPILAAGAGRVIKSGYDKYNGHHVFIQHPGSIVTKYLHFKERRVKKGQSVKQGQVIGTLGATGMVTGAHLHYEFVVNGVHRNPRTVPLPKADPLTGDALASFQAAAAPWQTRLGRLESASLYAARE
ncbi:MAG: peptidoglycan DD-metalloendopeptidase family protein [Xanthomonadales bacterium]|nr:peptidoglycan DD-metalloendopeptidase family protein [Xanthomonadales bacterium]